MIPTTTPDVIVDPALFELGFKHGQLSMLRASLAHDKSYMVGFRAGLQFYTSKLPDVKESHDEIGWHDEPLNSLDGHGMA
jgi:hypothetical protein